MTTIALFLADSFSASSRFRLLAYCDLLAKDGIRVTVHCTTPSKYLPYPAALPRAALLGAAYGVVGSLIVLVQRVWQVLTVVPSASVVVLQKDLMFRTRVDLAERLMFAVSRRFGVRVCFDIDDAIYLGTSSARLGFADRKVRRIALRSDVVLAGSSPILEWATRAGAYAILMPTGLALDPDVGRDYARRGATLRLAWSGTASSSRSMDCVLSAIEELRRHSAVSIEIVSRIADLPRGFQERVPTARFTEWSPAAERRALDECDIALAPLVDDEFSRARCGGKVLSYFGAGVPVVGSPVGGQAELLHHNITGLVVLDCDGWMKAIDRLAGDEALRKRLGRAGRRLVETQRDVRLLYPALRAQLLGTEAAR